MSMPVSAWIQAQQRAGRDWRAAGDATAVITVGRARTDQAGRAMVASPNVERKLKICRAGCPEYEQDGGWGRCRLMACSSCYLTELRRGRAPEGCVRSDQLRRA
jgi:hypothetical protein